VVSNWPGATGERPAPKPAEPLVWPLTGLTAPSSEAISSRVVSVKIENSREARPQAALQSADVVYESVTEGGITRFNALFHSQAPTTVGPVRSARLSDTDIVPQYKALFCFSGASAYGQCEGPGGWHREPERGCRDHQAVHPLEQAFASAQPLRVGAGASCRGGTPRDGSDRTGKRLRV